jgi:hypothetical protein
MHVAMRKPIPEERSLISRYKITRKGLQELWNSFLTRSMMNANSNDVSVLRERLKKMMPQTIGLGFAYLVILVIRSWLY